MICHESFIKIIREHKSRTQLFRDLEHSEKIRILFSNSLTASPAAPVNLSLTPGDNTIDASVDAYTGATEYNWYLDSVLIASTVSPTYQFTGLTNEQEYDVFATATTLGIESKATAIQQATPTDVIAPAAPTNLVGTPGDGIVDLDWDDNAEGDFAYYNVYQDSVEIATNVLVSDYQVTGLTNGQEYDFEVTAVDDDDNESALSNTVSVTPVSAVVNKNISSLSFDGVDDYVEIPNTNDLEFGSNDFTINAWFRSPPSGNITIWDSGLGGGSSEYVWIYIDNTGDTFIRLDDGSGSATITSDLSAYFDDLWHHISVVRDGNTLRLYIDTLQIDTEDISSIGSVSNNLSTFIGRYYFNRSPGNDDIYSLGNIDEIQVWDKALSRSEIVTNANKILSGDETNLVGYWNAEDRDPTQLTDLTANAKHGTINGATYAYDGFDFDYSLSFDGIDDHVEVVGYQGIGGTNERTFECWYKSKVSGEDHVLFSYGDNGAGIAYVIRIDSANGNSLRVEVSGGQEYGSTDVQDGEWHHLVVVFPQGSNSVQDHDLYVDGVLETATGGGDQSMNTALVEDVFIGRYFADTTSREVDGFIDKVRFWDTERTQQEIQQNLNKELAGNEAGLVGYWKFDDLTDLGVAVDSSPSGNDGAINGATYSTDILSYYQALSFDGGTDYVNLGSNFNFAYNQPFSVSININPTQTPSVFQYFIGRENNSNFNEGWSIRNAPSPDREKVRFQMGSDASNRLSVETVSPVLSDQNIILTVTYDGSTNASGVTIYINGISQDSSIASDTLSSSISYVTDASIGRRLPDGGGAVDGILDEAQFWDKELSAQEVLDYIDSKLLGDESGLIGYYPMSEAVGSTVYDKTSNNNNGTITGAMFTEKVGVKV